MRERRMSLDMGTIDGNVQLTPVHSWLRHELETRGIDSMVYTRYILSILQQDSQDFELDSDFWNAHCLLRKPRGRKERRRSYNGEELKKSAAVECLRSATDEDQGIINLVEETYRKLKEQESRDGHEVSPPGGGGRHETLSRPVRASTPKRDREGYYEAFPALKEPNDVATEPTRPPQDSVWSKSVSLPFHEAPVSTTPVQSLPVKKRHTPRPYVYYKIDRKPKSKREGKKRSSTAKSSPSKPILKDDEGMKITEDILNLFKVHPENVQIRHPTIRRLAMPSTDGEPEEKYLYTGPLEEIFPHTYSKLRLYERVNMAEMYATSDVLELISNDNENDVSRFLPFFVTKKRFASSEGAAASASATTEETTTLAKVVGVSEGAAKMSPCAAEICAVETREAVDNAFLQDSSDSGSSSPHHSPTLITVDGAWVQDMVFGGKFSDPEQNNNHHAGMAFGALPLDLPPLTRAGEDCWFEECEAEYRSLVANDEFLRRDLQEPIGFELPRKFWPTREFVLEDVPPEVIVTEPGPVFGQDLLNEVKESSGGLARIDPFRTYDLWAPKVTVESPQTPVEPTIVRRASREESVDRNELVLSEKSVPQLNEPPKPCCIEQPCLRDVSPEAGSTGSQGLKSPQILEMDRNISPRASESTRVGGASQSSEESSSPRMSSQETNDSVDKASPVEEPELAAIVETVSQEPVPDGSVSSTSRLLEIMAEAQRSRLGLMSDDSRGPDSLFSPKERPEHDASSTVMAVKEVLSAIQAAQNRGSESVSEDSSDSDDADVVCQVCHGVVCVCNDVPLSRHQVATTTVLQNDVLEALRHNDVIRLRSQDSVNSETSYVSMMELWDNKESDSSPSSADLNRLDDLIKPRSPDDAERRVTPPSSYVIDERTRASFESRDSSSSTSDSGAEYLLKAEIEEDIDSVLAELNVPQEDLAYDESDDVFSHPSFDEPIDTSAWEAPVTYNNQVDQQVTGTTEVAMGALQSDYASVTTTSFSALELRSLPTDFGIGSNLVVDTSQDPDCRNEDEGIDDSPHDLLWLFDLCNLHHLYSELESEDTSTSPISLVHSYLDEMEYFLQDENNLAQALQALAYNSEYDDILSHLNRLLQSRMDNNDVDEYVDVRWTLRDSKPHGRASFYDTKFEEGGRPDRIFLPSSSSAFKDKIPPRQLGPLPLVLAESNIFMKIAPVIKVQKGSEDDAAKSTELFSPETHFRPILTTPEEARRNYDILTKPDIYNNVYPSDMTQEYQEYQNPEAEEAEFVPKFRVSETQNKALQTDIKEKEPCPVAACTSACRESLESCNEDQTHGDDTDSDFISDTNCLSKVAPLSELCSRVVYKRNAALLQGQSPQSCSSCASVQTMIEREDLDLDEVFAMTLTLKSNDVSQDSSSGSEAASATSAVDNNGGTIMVDGWQQWSTCDDIWSCDDANKSTTNDWPDYLSRTQLVNSACYSSQYVEATPAPHDHSLEARSADYNNSGACNDVSVDLPPCPPGDEFPFSSELEEQWILQGLDQMYGQKSRKRTGSCNNRPCSFFMEGSCMRDDCRFSHDLSTITCRFWLKGECFKGVTCPFRHGFLNAKLLSTSQREKSPQVSRLSPQKPAETASSSAASSGASAAAPVAAPAPAPPVNLPSSRRV